MKELLDMFLTFARIGGFTFGGGYAMLPMLQKEVVNGRHWATDEELMDYYAIGQCTPGIIAVNTATFVGYKNRGIPGAIAATLGVIAPSLVIIMIIACRRTVRLSQSGKSRARMRIGKRWKVCGGGVRCSFPIWNSTQN